ncbi:uncharacterized protein LOC122332820 [Puntigrus tetrazona]|uniref:uncharacterized protein LOC122332820 n=1 Tax=Puntigrus tetrazona TaxID=1606681 RepID=UPI001C8A7E8C|nr:uncharacterized protein LOC122332820 [Puntigrus tetrazona]
MGLLNTIRLFHPEMIFFVLATFWIGTAAGVQDEGHDEIESLEIVEGENLTISIPIGKSEEDPQVLVTRSRGSSQERVAQMICHDGHCKHERWRPGVCLASDGQNLTLTLTNLSDDQTGLYRIRRPSSARPGEKVYNVTLREPHFTTISPASAVHSEPLTTRISIGVVVLSLVVVAAAAVGFVYGKNRKVSFNEVPQELNTVAHGR